MKKYCTGTKRLKHAMLRNSRAEFECDMLHCRGNTCAGTQCIHIKGEKTVPGIASTLPRARERGAKAYLRDGEARKATLIDPKGPANPGGNTGEAIASTQPELQRNFLQSTICKIGNHPQDCSTGITRQIHAKEKKMKKRRRLAIIGGYA